MFTTPEDRWIKGFLLPIPYLALLALLLIFGLPLYTFVSAPLKLIALLSLLYGGFFLILSKLLSAIYRRLAPFFSADPPLWPAQDSPPHTTLEWERIRRDVRYAMRKRNYFYRILRPQLLQLMAPQLQDHHQSPEGDQSSLPLPPDPLLRELLLDAERFRGKRVTLRYLQTLVARIEAL
ncbi:MAG: hypothetical protein D6736_21630 [Nitrospinota bacterium]|nr:MAG: hypothetical protein D6736_21630 [Nitrospinota bacterium]